MNFKMRITLLTDLLIGNNLDSYIRDFNHTDIKYQFNFAMDPIKLSNTDNINKIFLR